MALEGRRHGRSRRRPARSPLYVGGRVPGPRPDRARPVRMLSTQTFSGGRGLDFIYTNFRGFFALLLGSDVELDSISRLRDNAF